MSKISNYVASVEISSGMKPKNDNDFPLLEAHSIVVDENGTRLDERLAELEENSGSIEVTDVIEEGSTLPVTSGAVYEVFKFLEEI